MTFKYEPKSSTNIQDLNGVELKTLVDVIGNLKWLEEVRTVQCGEKKYVKKL